MLTPRVMTLGYLTSSASPFLDTVISTLTRACARPRLPTGAIFPPSRACASIHAGDDCNISNLIRAQARTRCDGYFHPHARMANLLIVTESMYPSCWLFPGGDGSTNLIGPEIANDISYRLCRSLQRDTCSMHGDGPGFHNRRRQ